MAQPTPYNRLYDFSDYQEVNPTKPLRGSEVDAEFDAIKLTTDQIRANAAQIQRDDGSLANQSVTPDSLSAGTLAMIHQGEYVPRGAWAAITAYAMGDLVTYNAATYLCIAAHTAQAAFPDDLAANRWVLIANGALSGQASAIDLFEGNAATTTVGLPFVPCLPAIDTPLRPRPSAAPMRDRVGSIKAGTRRPNKLKASPPVVAKIRGLRMSSFKKPLSP